LSASSWRSSGWIILGLLVVSAAVYLLLIRTDRRVLVPISSAILAQPLGDLPNIADKPKPDWRVSPACPPEGMGGDPDLNRLRNRVDKGDYQPVSFESLTALTWPKSVERLPMRDWSPSNRAFISQYLGIPLVVEGYIVYLREGGPDAASCLKPANTDPYWRIYLAKNPRDNRVQSVIAESTPQTRIGHTWTIDLIRSFIMAGRLQVRISGWLYFDPEHASDAGRTRATLWEISPVMQIEVFQDGKWNPLDKYGK
jgi:hypothetical protein